ncbi:hypothetical protein BHE74_00024554 [Ensete ventricosum]|nr:hypothetical protein GW17_00014228 [Ensete ventricosum]RWW67958.1 hypothetical protein BHE74_00024554 [Ensete ventricosum]
MRVVVCLFIDQGELLGGHSRVEAGGRKGRGSDNESNGAQLPKSKASIRKEVDSEEHYSAVEVDLSIAKEGIQTQGNGWSGYGLGSTMVPQSPTTRWRRPCMRVTVYLSIDQGELLGGHSDVEAGGQKERGNDDESSGAQLPKSKALVRKEVDSKEHHSAAEADLPIAKEGMQT